VDQATSLGISSLYELEIARFWYERSGKVVGQK
jgi:hypothetical protein